MTVSTVHGAEIEIRQSVGALALSESQTAWTPEQRAALVQLGVDKASDGDLAVFLHQSQKTGLDPFAKQIYMIGRPSNEGGRDETGRWVDRWVTKWTIQTGIDGFRVSARRIAEKRGETIEYEDALWCGKDGRWVDVWTSPEPPAAAKFVVVRNGSRFSGVARFGAYAQTKRDGSLNKQWETSGDVMISKCAEALAHRRAYPQDFSGVYIDEEMQHLDDPPPGLATAARHGGPSAGAAPAATALMAARMPSHEALEEFVSDLLAEIEDADVEQWRALNERVFQAENDGLDTVAVETLRGALQARLGELPASQRALKRMHTVLTALGMTDEQRRQAASNIVGRELASTSELTEAEADAVWRRAGEAMKDGGAASLLYAPEPAADAVDPDDWTDTRSPDEIAATS